MYRSNLNTRDKSGALAGVVAVHALLLLVLLQLSGRVDLADPQQVLRTFEVTEPPPPEPEPEAVAEPQRQKRPQPSEPEAEASPENIRSQATAIVAPKPRIPLPVPVPVAVTETPGEGTQATQGAGDIVGPGTGAGGTGAGTGSGGSGDGAGGGGGGGGVAFPPRLITPPLRGRDFPRDLLRMWPPGRPAFLRLRVDASGNVGECTLDRGTGVPAIDSVMCNLARERLRFRPAVDRQGRTVAGWVGYAQPPPR